MSPLTAVFAPTRSTLTAALTVEPLELAPETLRALREQLLLFYTGDARDAATVLGDQDKRTKLGDEEMLNNMHRTKEMGLRSRDLLLAGDLFAYAELMHEHWLNKRTGRRGWRPTASTSSIRSPVAAA